MVTVDELPGAASKLPKRTWRRTPESVATRLHLPPWQAQLVVSKADRRQVLHHLHSAGTADDATPRSSPSPPRWPGEAQKSPASRPNSSPPHRLGQPGEEPWAEAPASGDRSYLPFYSWSCRRSPRSSPSAPSTGAPQGAARPSANPRSWAADLESNPRQEAKPRQAADTPYIYENYP